MKLLYLLLFIALCEVQAQRRPTTTRQESDLEPTQRPLGRGRSRFSAPPEAISTNPENTIKRTTRKRVNSASLDRKPLASRNYEVEERLDDSPIDSFRRQSKPRVITETHFEAVNAPKKPLFKAISTTEEIPVEELIKKYGSQTVESSSQRLGETVSSTSEGSDLNNSEESSETSSEENLTTKAQNEIRKYTEAKTTTQASIEHPKRANSNRRSNFRTRSQTVDNVQEATSQAPRPRTRTRPTRKPENASPATATFASRTASRGSRRGSESSSKGPSVFGEEAQTIPSRSRTGRRIESQTPEKIVLDLPKARVPNRKAPSTSPATLERSDRNSRRRTSTRTQSSSSTTIRSTTPRRTRTRPTSIDRKLDLAEDRVGHESSLEENVLLSATENNVRYAKPDPNTISTETQESTYRRKPYARPKQTKESITSEVSEVISKRVVTRRRNSTEPKSRVKIDAPKISISEVITKQRKRKLEAKPRKEKSELSRSEEEIDESDNYPPQFKALIQAKKNQESRLPSKSHSASAGVRDEKVVTTSSAPATSSTTIKSHTVREIDFDNELVPVPTSTTPLPRTTKKRITVPRFSQKPRQRKAPRSTPAPSSTTYKSSSAEKFLTEHRFHAKLNPVQKNEPFAAKPVRSYTPKPPRGIYSSKNKENLAGSKNQIESEAISTQVPKSNTFHKSNRFSSRYRSDISARNIASRSTTSAPAYIPTIPTAAYVPTVPSLTPPSSSVRIIETLKDSDLGVEVISFDDPVNTVPSANLVSGEYLSANDNTLNGVANSTKNGTTEKPVSIIERIINSITAISTTPPPENETSVPRKAITTLRSSPTKASAILKLATKKSTDSNTTSKLKDPNDGSTSEKPTTVIERILNSLSAIQANDQNNSIQVGTDFNTIGRRSTTPMSRVTKSTKTVTLSALQSTTLNPLVVLDEISEEQTLQKRTIGQLLALLNGMTSTRRPRPSKLVVVTPKAPNALSLDSVTTTLPKTTTGKASLESVSNTTTPKATTTSFTTPTITTTSFTTPTTVSNEVPSGTEVVTPAGTTTQPESSSIFSLLPFFTTTTTRPKQESTITPEVPTSTTEMDDSFFTIPSTIPTHTNFEVSPDSVSIFSSNDLTNSITSDDHLISTVTISSRSSFDSSTTDSSESSATTTMTPTTGAPTTTSKPTTTTINNTTPNTNSRNNTKSNATSDRISRVLSFVGPQQDGNSIDTSTPDYFVFAVLPNNTILRKRPNTFPTKETPFVIVGILPNNTIVRKFPNGTLVPMEPIIRVRGFDTRANPPPLPEITSNQVTNDPGSPPDNKQTVDIDENTVPSIDANQLSVSSAASPPTAPPSTPAPASTTSSNRAGRLESSVTQKSSSTTPLITTSRPILSTISELLNGNTLKAFNEIVTKSDAVTKSNDILSSTANYEWNQVLNIQDLLSGKPVTKPSYDFGKDTSTIASPTSTISTSTLVPVTTTLETSTRLTVTPTEIVSLRETRTTASPTTKSSNSIFETSTIPQSTRRITTTKPRTTTNVPTTTFFPSFFSTIISTLNPSFFTTTPPTTRSKAEPTVVVTSQTVPNPTTTSGSERRGRVSYFDSLTTTEVPSTTTARKIRSTTVPTTIPPTTIFRTTLPPTTTRRIRTTRLTTTPPTTESFSYTSPVSIQTTPKLKQLTEEQKKNLATLAELEKEQAAILEQLSFLTGLMGNKKKTSDSKPAPQGSNLANRIIALAMNRDKSKTTTQLPTSIQDVLGRGSKKIQDPKLEEILKQYNISGLDDVTASPTLTPTYGKSNDALLAALLKQQGIGPTTPKGLELIYQETTTTRRPRPTTRQPGRLMQGLNWLLNAIAPPPTRRPKPRKPKELLSNQPTHITPVVTAAPRLKPNALSQEDIAKLIKQLEAVQKDPTKNELDFSKIKSLQGLITNDEGVQVISPVKSGTTSQFTSSVVAQQSSPVRSRVVKSTTVNSVYNNLDDEEFEDEYTTPKPRLPPVRLRPVPGVDENADPLIRGNLITAAVNVTRAISSFLGSALQGAATSFQSLLGSGSRLVGNISQGSSLG